MPTRINGKPVYVENVDYISDFDPYTAVFDWAPSGLDRATGIMDSESKSYRVKVGTVVTNYDEATKKIIGYGGANYKPNEEEGKECAELTAQSEAMKRRGKASRLGGALVPILFDVVSSASPAQIESIIGVPLPTLPPCRVCRDTLLPENAVVITKSVAKDRQKRSDDNSIVEVHTGLEVIQIGDPSRFKVKKTRPREIERVYPRRVLKNPTVLNFEKAKLLYLDEVAAFSDRPDQDSRMLRAELVVRSLFDTMN